MEIALRIIGILLILTTFVWIFYFNTKRISSRYKKAKRNPGLKGKIARNLIQAQWAQLYGIPGLFFLITGVILLRISTKYSIFVLLVSAAIVYLIVMIDYYRAKKD